MNLGSDPADQVVRYTLEGTEYALRLSGVAAKNFIVFVTAVLRDQKKTHGKTRLIRLLREGKPLKFFAVSSERMREFTREANRHGLLFVPMRDRRDPDTVEIAIWAEDAAKVERIIERMQMDVVQTGEAEMESAMTHEHPTLQHGDPDQQPAQTGGDPIPLEFEPEDAAFDMGFTPPAPQTAEPVSKGELHPMQPGGPLSVQHSAGKEISPDILPRQYGVPLGRGERTSVREELRQIRAMLFRRNYTPKPQVPVRIKRKDKVR